MTPLNNGPVNANALETSVMKLWQEFLAQYFDGGKHDVGATPQVQFPAAELLFQQSAVTQPLAAPNLGLAAGGLAITMVGSEGHRRKWTAWESLRTANNPNGPNLGVATRQEICYEAVAWNFWVRANGTNGRRCARAGAMACSGC